MSKGNKLRMWIGIFAIAVSLVSYHLGIQMIRTEFSAGKRGNDTGGMAVLDGWEFIIASIIENIIVIVFCFLPAETSWKIFNWIMKWFK
jgi:hypothetical protein